MNAIIIAAGKGTRLGPLTESLPKSLLPINGKPLIEYTFETLRACGITSITIITGYKAEKFTYDNVTYRLNAEFKTNNILHSLMTAKEDMTDDVIISYSDIWYSPHVLKQLIDTPGDIVVSVDVDWMGRYEGRTEHPLEEAENVILHNNLVKNIGKHLDAVHADGEFIGLVKLTQKGAQQFTESFAELNAQLTKTSPFEQSKEWQKAYLTDFLQWLIDHGNTVTASMHKGEWLEMDTRQDYETAGSIIQRYT